MVQGDTLEITLESAPPAKGGAWLRTNVGHAAPGRDAIIAHVDDNAPLLGRDWFDIPMQRLPNGCHSIVLGLSEVGHFQAKCFLLPENTQEPLWPSGENLVINVEPADTCCGNTIYNAFVRLFGPNKHGPAHAKNAYAETIKALDQAGYTIIPPSGTFRSLISDLDFIIGTLGCRIIQLLPIHPTPTTYARMGRFGSPYASLSFTAVDPALAEFDPKATPLDQFLELVDAVHTRNGKLFLDIAINHTGWAASLHATHPHWLARTPEGEIEVPGAWGVTWADLTRLDYRHKALWQFMAEVFITWCKRGVDGFRCDAGYMIPLRAWQYIIARVRNQFPQTCFLLEGLGGKISVTRDLLNRANFNWTYSELFQNYEREQVETYLDQARDISQSDGLTVHFAETHDNNRLAANSHTYARMRTSLCALLSFQGAFGFSNGLEWLATEKINVHEATSLNWGAGDNQVDHIRRLNTILKTHPCFDHKSRFVSIHPEDRRCIGMLRHHLPSGKNLLILINLDDKHVTMARWLPAQHRATGALYDLLSDRRIRLGRAGDNWEIELAPGEALCLSADRDDLQRLESSENRHLNLPELIVRQTLRAKVLAIFRAIGYGDDLRGVDVDDEASRLENDPLSFCKKLNRNSEESRVITWTWPRDIRREVMLPPGHFLLIQAPTPFQCRLLTSDDTVIFTENGFECTSGIFFALVLPTAAPQKHTRQRLHIALFEKRGCVHQEAPILYLSDAETASVQTMFRKENATEANRLALGTNGMGSMMRAHVVEWDRLDSRYDGLLAANLDERYPVDRWMMLARFRGWIVYQGYSQAIGPETLDRSSFTYASTVFWHHKIPTGNGEHIELSLCLEMIDGKNMIRLSLFRHPTSGRYDRLSDAKAVTVILRPDIEDRNFHDTTKAYTGPETQWKNSVSPSEKGFVFHPHPERRMHVDMQKGRFIHQPEWQYMVSRPIESERGLDADSDLFSPGYFTAGLLGGETLSVVAAITRNPDEAPATAGAPLTADPPDFYSQLKSSLPLPDALQKALDQYLVKRNGLSTIIAGYPWFLDWGRDTLIVARALVAVGKTDAAKSIVKQFAGLEKGGTIPNMLHGADSGNRDTSDAPLWLFTLCSDLAATEDGPRLFEMDCAGRPLQLVLSSMARAMMSGTLNNIKMDSESGLIFSPAHFTWMDTNHPACTPRQGYPIEIQALWHAALALLARIDRTDERSKWRDLSARVSHSIQERFYLPEKGYLSDCLHAAPGMSAFEATPDDALRPNQLLAVTLGAVGEIAIAKKILSACEALLVPGAIRSLADQPVHPPLEIIDRQQRINTLETPYQGRYQGDENTSRKPAYHNGTAWTWLFPSYCEAWYRIYGEASKATALAWLSSSTRLINSGCVGHVPEILDGDAPHRQRGCDAQAWGVSELLRVWTLIEKG